MARSRNRSRFRDIHGIVLLDKPLGLSSNQALQRVRHIVRAAKAGHTGSLDPLATGLLPVCLGEATKVAGHLLGSRKAYAAEVKLGTTTSTDDGEGYVVEQAPVPTFDEASLRAALAPFIGTISQVPPAYSALKRDGVPLYKLARRGEVVDVPAREVEIFAIDLLRHDGDTLCLRVECGSGTYIRSLARDLGQALGCGAHLSALRRLWVEPFSTPSMLTLEQLEALASEGDAALENILLPVDAGLAGMPAVHLDAEDSWAMAQGEARVRRDLVPGLYRVYADDGRLLALGEVGDDARLRSRRGFNLPG